MSAIFGEMLVFGQHNGPNLQLRVFGDEFYARYELPNGYTVVYDLDRGQYCYAVLEDGNFVSSGTPVTKSAPKDIRRHLKEDGNIRNKKMAQRFSVLRAPSEPFSASSNVMRGYGPNSGLLTGRQLATGDVRGLTILVEFDDLRTEIKSDDVDALLNGQGYKEHGNYCSVNEYFKLMSSGKLNYTNRVVGPVRLRHKQSYYINNLLVYEALEKASGDYNLDLGEFDSNNDGIVDAVSFMYAGRSLYAGNLWPHNYHTQYVFGGYRTHFYTIQSLGRSNIDLSIGTFTHESGHMICRFPDLYDYGERGGDFEDSSGLGQYCLMSWGNHLGNGKRPSPVCAYLRNLVGWCDDVVNLNNPGAYEAKHGDYGTVMRYSTDKSHEYFLVENRNKGGLDHFLPDSGLAVYHCDTRGSNEYQDGTPDNHYQCALIQADGKYDLENTTRGGDDGDLYESADGTVLSDITVPHSREWDGTDSGLCISDIGPAGDRIEFFVGEKADRNIVTESIVEDRIIPDYDAAGIVSELHVSVSGALLNIKVDVMISHTYRGDLNVELEAPSGKRVVLHSKQGGQLDNLELHLDSGSFAPLSELEGESVQGDWKLYVSDLLRSDVGRLDSWSVTIEYQGSDTTLKKEAVVDIAIPDHTVSGIKSTINIPDAGSVKGLSVELDISHTYRGDIQAELIAPTGQRALLIASDGDSRRDINEIYSDKTVASLRALIGDEVRGDWTLHVRDLAAYDVGKLRRWSLEICV